MWWIIVIVALVGLAAGCSVQGIAATLLWVIGGYVVVEILLFVLTVIAIMRS